MSFFQAKLKGSWLYADCKEGKRDDEVLRERMGVAVDEEGRKCRRRRQNPLQQHSSRAREREKEGERDGCIPPWLFPPPSSGRVLSGMQPSRHIRNEF